MQQLSKENSITLIRGCVAIDKLDTRNTGDQTLPLMLQLPSGDVFILLKLTRLAMRSGCLQPQLNEEKVDEYIFPDKHGPPESPPPHDGISQNKKRSVGCGDHPKSFQFFIRFKNQRCQKREKTDNHQSVSEKIVYPCYRTVPLTVTGENSTSAHTDDDQ